MASMRFKCFKLKQAWGVIPYMFSISIIIYKCIYLKLGLCVYRMRYLIIKFRVIDINLYYSILYDCLKVYGASCLKVVFRHRFNHLLTVHVLMITTNTRETFLNYIYSGHLIFSVGSLKNYFLRIACTLTFMYQVEICIYVLLCY